MVSGIPYRFALLPTGTKSPTRRPCHIEQGRTSRSVRPESVRIRQRTFAPLLSGGFSLLHEGLSHAFRSGMHTVNRERLEKPDAPRRR